MYFYMVGLLSMMIDRPRYADVKKLADQQKQLRVLASQKHLFCGSLPTEADTCQRLYERRSLVHQA